VGSADGKVVEGKCDTDGFLEGGCVGEDEEVGVLDGCKVGCAVGKVVEGELEAEGLAEGTADG